MLLIACTALVGCGARPSDLEALGLEGKVKSIEQRLDLDIVYYNDFIQYGSFELQSNHDMDFSEDGYVEKITYYDEGKKTGRYSIELDKKGYLLEANYKSYLNSYKNKMVYDSEDDLAIVNDLIQEGEGGYSSNNEEGEFYSRIVYNEAGQLIESEYGYDYGGVYSKIFNYEDDILVGVEGNKHETIYQTEFLYDDGLLIGYIYETGNKSNEYEFRYKDFDKSGNWIEMDFYRGDILIGTLEREIEYY